MYLFAKDSYEAKYQVLVNKRKVGGLRYYNGSKAFLELK